MAESYYLLAATFMPLLLSPVAYFLGRIAGLRAVTWFSLGVLIISTGLLFVPASMLNGGRSVYIESYPWGQFGNFGLRLDGLSLPFAIINYIWFTVLIMYSKTYMNRRIVNEARVRFGGGDITQITSVGGVPAYVTDEERRKDTGVSNIESGPLTTTTTPEMQRYVDSQLGLYFALYMVFAMGTLAMILATNLIEFYVFFELVLLVPFFLIAFYGYGSRHRTALMFFFWTHVGSVVLLLGLLAIGFFAGGFDYSTVRAHESQIPVQWMPIIIFAVVMGLGVKLGGFLLHPWIPSSQAYSPTPVAIMLVGIATYGFLRIWLDLLGGNYAQYSLYVNIWGLATMIYGGAMALMQDDIRKVLAYSTMSNMGYILFGIGSASVLGVTGVTLLYVTSGLGKAILFMMAGSISLQTGTTSMSKLGGLAGKMPYTAVVAMIGVLTLFGIPPTSGFMSEWILFNGVLQTGVHDANSLRIVLFGFGILTTVLSSAYLLWMYKRIFFGKIPKELVNVRDSGRYITITMAVFAGVTLIIGVYPAPLLTPIATYVQGMFHNTPGVVPLPQFQNSQGIVPLPQPGGSGHAVPVAKNIVFKSGYGFIHNSPAVLPLSQPGGSGHAVPVAKNIVFKSSYGLSSNTVLSSVAAGRSNNGGGSTTYLEMKSEHMVGLKNG